MVEISRNIVVFLSFLGLAALAGILFTPFEKSILYGGVYIAGIKVNLLSIILFSLAYSLGRAVYHGAYIPILCLIPILPELSYVSRFIRRSMSRVYNTLTENILALFNYRTQFEDRAVKIARVRIGFILKSIFVGLAFAWVSVEFYQNINPTSSNQAIQLVLLSAQTLSTLIPLHYIVAQLGGLMLAFASVRALSLEISYLDEASHYEFSYRVFAELVSGGILFIFGLLFPAFQSIYSLLQSLIGFSDLSASVIISIVSLLFVTSVAQMLLSMLAGILGFLDLLLMVYFANALGIHDEITILILMLLVAAVSYSIYLGVSKITESARETVTRWLLKQELIKI